MSHGLSMVIEEVQPAGSSNATPARFEWNVFNRALPRGPWPGGVHIRKSSDPAPGSAEVAEQVLGPTWKPFTLVGRWEDRFGGVGFAQRTLDAFRALVARGGLCKFTLGVETVAGLIDDFDYTRERLRGEDGTWARVGYSFTVTPHTQDGSGLEPQPLVQQRLATSAAKLIARLEALQTAFAFAHGRAPRQALAGDSYAAVNGPAEATLEALQRAALVVDTRAAPTIAPNPTSGLARAMAAFGAVSEAALATCTAARSLRAADALSFESVAVASDFCAWSIGVQTTGLQLAAAASAAATELRARILPDGVALYRPTSTELLASIALRYYGTPHRWRDIMRRNHLRSPVLTGDELLVIPR